MKVTVSRKVDLERLTIYALPVSWADTLVNGINDTPALSMADVSISLQDSSDIARELADITLVSNSLNDIVALRMISEGLFKRIHSQYRLIVGLNTSFIVLGALGLLTPQMLAMLHNGSTFLIASGSTRSLLH